MGGKCLTARTVSAGLCSGKGGPAYLRTKEKKTNSASHNIHGVAGGTDQGRPWSRHGQHNLCTRRPELPLQSHSALLQIATIKCGTPGAVQHECVQPEAQWTRNANLHGTATLSESASTLLPPNHHHLPANASSRCSSNPGHSKQTPSRTASQVSRRMNIVFIHTVSSTSSTGSTLTLVFNNGERAEH